MATVKVQQPGVYIEEMSGLSMSIASNPTTVTAFVGDFGGLSSDYVKVYAWPDFTALPPAGEGKEDARQDLGRVLRAYFQNGGGYCYLVSTADSTLTEGLAVLSKLGDVTVVVAPGLWDQGATRAGEWARALTGWAAENRAMALLHTDRDHTPEQAGAAIDTWGLDEKLRPYAAVYFPWLRPTGDDKPLVPIGAVAGAWTTVDCERGVWKAPANIALRGIDGPKYEATDTDQSTYRNLNFIRTFSGHGTLIWGARTLSGTQEWRYIPVRRLCSTVERDIQRALQTVMFEPNSQPTWEKVRAAVDSYLNSQWKQGGLMGNSDKEAYFVQVGKDITMTQDDVDGGRLILKVGLAAVRPAEFIILEITQEMLA
ncbi:phage tail sheath C-terminal domain-containing protein [Streptomyces sp. NPDC005989]|uniref:phage tail sheath family protein n=1 Tax=Streptomyces sp. NPDC005989 TaxID=3156727 RepID=UPI0033F6E4A0